MWNHRFDAACGAVIFFLTFVAVVIAKDFGYGVELGPATWARHYEQCNGKHQSPINIDKVSVIKLSYPELNYFNFNERPKSVTLSNNGHTVLVTMDFPLDKEPRISGGPLKTNAVYQFQQFHFHWGENNTVGSEDTINNQRYPAELHVVMRSLDYPNIDSALEMDQGIAVMAFFFKVIEKKDNPHYGEFVEILADIKGKGSSKDLVEARPLWKFLSTYSTNYYTYIGSLTTPPCSEKVIWIDYHDAIYISDYQLNLFRELTANDEHLKNNFRPIQALNDRLIYENIPHNLVKDWTPPPNAATFTGSFHWFIQLGIGLLVLHIGNNLSAFN